MRTWKCVSRPIGRPHDELRARRAMLRLHRRDFNRSGSRHLLVAPAAARVHTVGSVGPRAGMTTTPPIATHVRRPTRLSSVAELVTTAWLCICVRRGGVCSACYTADPDPRARFTGPTTRVSRWVRMRSMCGGVVLHVSRFAFLLSFLLTAAQRPAGCRSRCSLEPLRNRRTNGF